MKIQVTEENIADGFPNDAYSCPVGLAIQGLFPEHKAVYVDEKFIRVQEYDDKERYERPHVAPKMETSRVWLEAETPKLVAEFIHKFDGGDTDWPLKIITNPKLPNPHVLEPFEFEVTFVKVYIEADHEVDPDAD